jgi:hypothetical protein
MIIIRPMAKWLLSTFAALLLMASCNSKATTTEQDQRSPITSIEEAKKYIGENFNDSIETLWVSDKLNDPMGFRMAIIGDSVLAAGYMPDGFEQQDGYRIYKYIKH